MLVERQSHECEHKISHSEKTKHIQDYRQLLLSQLSQAEEKKIRDLFSEENNKQEPSFEIVVKEIPLDDSLDHEQNKTLNSILDCLEQGKSALKDHTQEQNNGKSSR